MEKKDFINMILDFIDLPLNERNMVMGFIAALKVSATCTSNDKTIEKHQISNVKK